MSSLSYQIKKLYTQSLSDISKIIPNGAQILENRKHYNSLEVGVQWQVHKYLEEDSYREIRLTLEKDDSNDFFQIVLGDDLIDYDQTASGEEQYFLLIDGDSDEAYNKTMKIFTEVVKSIEETKDSHEKFQQFEETLRSIGFTCRHLSEK